MKAKGGLAEATARLKDRVLKTEVLLLKAVVKS